MNQQELTTNLPTRNQQLKAWSNWFTNQEDWQLFAFTVVFKQRKKKKDELLEPLALNQSVCESLFKVQVLHKIRRALERNAELQLKAVPYWAVTGSVDTDLSELRLLELYRTHVAQC